MELNTRKLNARIIRMPGESSVTVCIEALGMKPATKGSYRVISGKSRLQPGRTVSRLIPDNKMERTWRDFICLAVSQLGAIPKFGRDYAVATSEDYYLVRPKSVRESAREDPNVKPDIDKLIRATHDALTDSGLIADDSIICSTNASKTYVESLDKAGVMLTLECYPNTKRRKTKNANPGI